MHYGSDYQTLSNTIGMLLRNLNFIHINETYEKIKIQMQ